MFGMFEQDVCCGIQVPFSHGGSEVTGIKKLEFGAGV